MIYRELQYTKNCLQQTFLLIILIHMCELMPQICILIPVCKYILDNIIVVILAFLSLSAYLHSCIGHEA